MTERTNERGAPFCIRDFGAAASFSHLQEFLFLGRSLGNICRFPTTILVVSCNHVGFYAQEIYKQQFPHHHLGRMFLLQPYNDDPPIAILVACFPHNPASHTLCTYARFNRLRRSAFSLCTHLASLHKTQEKEPRGLAARRKRRKGRRRVLLCRPAGRLPEQQQ